MTLTFTREELEKAIFPLGYVTMEQNGTEGDISLAITHPDHEGLSIEIALRNEEIVSLERVVRGGAEQEMFDASPFPCSPEFFEIPKEHQDRLFTILLGEPLTTKFENVDEFLVFVAEKIKVKSTL